MIFGDTATTMIPKRCLTFGSLFSGIGGLDLGLERAGLTCNWQVEIDEYANRVLAKHWPDIRRWGDIRTFPPDTESGAGRWPAERKSEGREFNSWSDGETWSVDLICGGFPCQDISYAGRGAGLDGERSGLFFEAIRVVRQLRPRYVLLENVAALLTRGLDRVHGELASLGYSTESHCIPAAAVGAPHIRDRVFVVGYSAGEGSFSSTLTGVHSGEEITGSWDAESERRSEAVADSKGERLGKRRQGRTTTPSERRDTPREDVADTDDQRLEGYGREYELGKTSSDKSSAGSCQRAGNRFFDAPIGGEWLPEPDVGRVAHGVPSRVDRLRGLGNAVVPQVAEWIGRGIIGDITIDDI